MRFLASALMLMIGGCDRPAPKLSDAQVEELRQGLPGMTEACLEKARVGGIEVLPNQIDACFEMTPPRRWRGLWRDEFEGSRFCPAPARQCDYHTSGDKIWLNFSSQQRTKAPGGLYELEFIGRRTAVRGHYGHMGMSDHEMIVDRMISLKELEAPPPPPTPAEEIAQWEACRAARTCIPSAWWNGRIKKLKEQVK